MDRHIKKVYVPMTETAFFILLCLRIPNHGYGIVQMVEKMPNGAIRLTPAQCMVVYQLDYNKDGLAHKDEYLKLFEDCSWEYLQDHSDYSYFRKTVYDDGVAEEIFCDDESRFQMMQRLLKGRMLPLLAIFCVLLLQFLKQLIDTHNYFLATFTGIVLIMYIVVFAIFFAKYYQYKRNRK